MNKVALTRLIVRTGFVGLSAAKHAVDDLLDGGPKIYLGFATERAALKFVRRAKAVGAILEAYDDRTTNPQLHANGLKPS